jgi:hypothetical protein
LFNLKVVYGVTVFVRAQKKGREFFAVNVGPVGESNTVVKRRNGGTARRARQA